MPDPPGLISCLPLDLDPLATPAASSQKNNLSTALPPMPIPPPAPRPPSPPAIVHERSPPNAEPPPGALLADGVYTRLKTAFWRNHAGLPGVGFEEDWELRVSSAAVGGGGEEGEEKEVWKGGLRELHERWGGSERRLRVALQCAGPSPLSLAWP